MFLPVSVCLFVCLSEYSKATDQIFMKLYGMFRHNPGANQLNF